MTGSAGAQDPDALRGTRRSGLTFVVWPLGRTARTAALPAARQRARWRADWRKLPGWLFAGITVLPALLVMAWLLAGLPLLLAGRFARLPMVVIFAPLTAAFIIVSLRRVPVRWPHGISDAPAAGAGRRHQRADVPWWALASTLAVAAGFAAWQLAMNSPQIIAGRDPGEYLQFGYWIAGHGSARIPESLSAFGGAHAGLGFGSAGFLQQGPAVIPALMAGLPMVLAAGIWAGGVTVAAGMAPVIGACAVLAFGGLAGRLAGARWAPAAALVLALSLPEQYTSRSAFGQPLAQLMLCGGLCLLIDSLVVTSGRHSARPAGAAAPGWYDLAGSRDWPAGSQPVRPAGHGGHAGSAVTLAALGGVALGLTALTGAGGLSDLLPVIPFLGVMLVARRVQAIPFGIGLIIGTGYGLADGYLLARPYFGSLAPSLRPLSLIAAGFAAVTAAGMALTAVPWTRAAVRRLVRARPLRWLPEAAAALVLLVLAGFVIRPYLQTVRGEDNPAAVRYVAGLQQIAHLPADGHRQYYEDSLYWVIWYIGVPAVLLAAFGVAVCARRIMRALLTWRDTGAARVWALPLMMTGWVTVSVLYRPATLPDQPWASRRLVPFVLPGLILAGVWAAAWLRQRGRALGAGRVAAFAVASCCLVALLVPAAVTAFGVGLADGRGGTGLSQGRGAPRRLVADGLALERTNAGEYDAARALCAAIGPDASVVIIDPLTADRFSQLVRGMCATPAARLGTPTPASVRAVTLSIEQAGRRPVLLAGTQSRLAPYGGAPREVLDLLTRQEPHTLTQPPTGTWPIRYQVWLSRPAAGAALGEAADHRSNPIAART
jgi:hypothetical protein